MKMGINDFSAKGWAKQVRSKELEQNFQHIREEKNCKITHILKKLYLSDKILDKLQDLVNIVKRVKEKILYKN